MTSKKAPFSKIVSILFFHFNNLILPSPIVFTNVLSLLVLRSKDLKDLVRFIKNPLLILSIYAIIHLYNGVEWLEYFQTYGYNIVLLITIYCTYRFLKERGKQIEKDFKLASIVAFVIFLLSLLLLLTPYSWITWKEHAFLKEQVNSLRYKGLGYEPSYLAYLCSPLFLYFFLKMGLERVRTNIFYFLMVAVPIVLTLSFGFFFALFVASFLATCIIFIRYRRLPSFVNYLVILFLLLGSVLTFSDNVISRRVVEIAKGQDTSVNGRTVESFMLAKKMAEEKNVWFGIGVGQVEIIGEEYIRGYYLYSKEEWPTVALPNAAAETLAIFGILGILLRFGLELFLFIKFKVYENYFSLLMFLFLFVYQLMGSYITSTTEYSLWILALVPRMNSLQIKLSKE